MKQSTFLGLNLMDIGKAAFLFLITNILGAIGHVVDAGHFPTVAEIIQVLKISGFATISYLLKQFLSNSQGVPLKVDPKA